MIQFTIATLILLSQSAAPMQDAKNQNAGQMREVEKAPESDQASPGESGSQPANPPISANQPAKGDGDTQSGATSGAPAAGSRRTLLEDGPEPRRRVPASDILERLRKETKKTPIIVPQTVGVQRVQRDALSEAAIPDNALRPVDRKLLPDGSRIVDRAGRLARDGEYLTFSFESRGEGPVEVPLRLLPNRLLEDMEMISEGGRKSVVFVVSGEVTEYRGVNYLLLQKLLMRPDLGNFR